MKKLITFSILILAFIVASGQKVSNTYQYVTYHYGGIKVGKSKRTVQIDSIVNQSGMLKFYSGGASVPVTVDTGDVATKGWVTEIINDGTDISALAPMLADSGNTYVTPFQLSQFSGNSIPRDTLYIENGKLVYRTLSKTYRVAVLDSTEATASASGLADGLIAYWKFDETTGTSLNDAVGSNDGTISGGTLINQTGKILKAASFDGDGDYISVAASSDFDVTSTISVSAWVYVSSSSGGNNYICKDRGGIGGSPWTFFLMNGHPAYTATGDATVEAYGTSLTVTTGAWNHVVTTINSTTGQVVFYLNGVSDNRSFTGQAIATKASDILIGRDAYSFFSGSLDEIGIWNRVLSADEVSELYNSGTGNQYPF